MEPELSGLLAPFRDAPQYTGMFLDFDGTLSPIVDDPATAVLIAGAETAIRALAERLGLVAIVSGRTIEFLVEHLEVGPNVRLRGLYGLQQWRNGAVTEDPQAAKWRAVVDEGATTAEAQLPKDVHIERKGMSFAIHFRRAPELRAMAEEWAARYANTSGLDARSGRLSVEIGPFLNLDKGANVSELCEGLRAVCVIGDDAGDIPMFKAARECSSVAGYRSLNIAVRSDEMPPGLLEHSDASVEGPEGVLEVLQYLTS